MAVEFFNWITEAVILFKDIVRRRIPAMMMIIHMMENWQTTKLLIPMRAPPGVFYGLSSILNQILLDPIIVIMKVERKTIIMNKLNVYQVDPNQVMDQ